MVRLDQVAHFEQVFVDDFETRVHVSKRVVQFQLDVGFNEGQRIATFPELERKAARFLELDRGRPASLAAGFLTFFEEREEHEVLAVNDDFFLAVHDIVVRRVRDALKSFWRNWEWHNLAFLPGFPG